MIRSLLLLGEGLVTPERLAGAAQDAPFQLAHERRVWRRLAQWGQGAGCVEEWQEWQEWRSGALPLRPMSHCASRRSRSGSRSIALLISLPPHILPPHPWRALRRRIPGLLLLSGQPARE
jgi:hypothetical protein